MARAAHEGLDFAHACLRAADGLPAADLLIGVVSVTTWVDEDFWMQGIVVRFYTTRGDYPDWYDDLERYERNAIALARLSEEPIPGWQPYKRLRKHPDTEYVPDGPSEQP